MHKLLKGLVAVAFMLILVIGMIVPAKENQGAGAAALDQEHAPRHAEMGRDNMQDQFEEPESQEVLSIYGRADCDTGPAAKRSHACQREATTARSVEWKGGRPVTEKPLWTGDLEHNPAALTASGNITGTVTQIGGLEISGIQVDAYQHNGSYWANVQYDTTDGNGVYDLGGLPAGIYRLGFSDPNGAYITEYHDSKPEIEDATDVMVYAAGTTVVDAALAVAGHINGKVTAETGGANLSDIEVSAYLYSDGRWKHYDYDDTAGDGTYSIKGLPTGYYKVEFDDNSGSFVPEYFDNVSNKDSATIIPVTAGSITDGIDAMLASASHITGSVAADDGGALLKDIYVCAYVYNGEWWENINCEYTDATGVYDVGGLGAGTYRLRFTDDVGDYVEEYYNNAPDVDSATDIFVAANVVVPGRNALLATAGRISGTITAEDDSALLQSILVEAHQYDGGYWDYVAYDYSDGSGNYSLGGLSTGNYRIQFEDQDGVYIAEYYDNVSDVDSANDVLVTAGSTTAAIDAALSTASHITGTVTADVGGALLGDIAVVAFKFDGTRWDDYGTEETANNGQYDLGGLTAGIYRLGFFDMYGDEYLGEYFNDSPDLENAADISVAAAETAPGKDAALALAGHITGTITAETGGAGLYDIEACAYSYDGSDWEQYNCGDTDPDGKYDIGGLPTDTYRVMFEDYNALYAWEYYDNAYDYRSSTDIPVTAGGTTPNINAALADGADITGTVTAEAGGAFLEEIDADIYRMNGANWDWVGFAHTDNYGEYDAGGLPAGTYRIGFFDYHVGDYQYEYYNDAADLASAADVTLITGGTASDRDAALAAAAHIKGKVTAEADGASLYDIEVCAWSMVGSSWEDLYLCGYTDDKGKYDIGGLRGDAYRVKFYDYDGVYAVEYYDNTPYVALAHDVSVSSGDTINGIDAAMATNVRLLSYLPVLIGP